jgi:lactoylglutathione lyase
MIRQLAHLCFFSDQIDQMVKFYCDGLGLPVKFTLNNDAGQIMGYYFECGSSTFIEVFDQEKAVKQWGGKIQANVPGGLYQHFCLEVTDLEGVKQELETRGIQVSAVTTGIDFSRQAWINDPDGHAIELMEYTHQSMQLQRSA